MSAANKVAYCGGQIRRRLIWIVVAALMSTWVWYWLRPSSWQVTVMVFGIGIAYALAWLVVAIINWYRAKAALAAISPGVAMSLDRLGVWIHGIGMAWPEIAQISVTQGRFGGSPSLNVKRLDGHVVSVSLADLDMMAGTIDAAVRSYSSGTQQIDTAKLGN